MNSKIVCWSLLFFSVIFSLQARRVPYDRWISPDDPQPKDREVEQETELVDFPSVWDWTQFFARINANYQYNGTRRLGDQWWFEMDQPLYVSPHTRKHTLFFQSQAMFQESQKTFNNGLSYRYLFYKDRYILGINGFYDYAYQNSLQRWSVGGDFHTQWLLIWGNYYGGDSKWKKVSIEDDTTTWERTLSGGDITASAPFPYLPWFRLQAGFYIWDYVEGKPDALGYKISLRANILKPLFIEGGRMADRYTQDNYVLVSLSFGFPNYIQFTMVNDTVSRGILPARTLKRFILDIINRNNTIRTQTKTI